MRPTFLRIFAVTCILTYSLFVAATNRAAVNVVLFPGLPALSISTGGIFAMAVVFVLVVVTFVGLLVPYTQFWPNGSDAQPRPVKINFETGALPALIAIFGLTVAVVLAWVQGALVPARAVCVWLAGAPAIILWMRVAALAGAGGTIEVESHWGGVGGGMGGWRLSPLAWLSLSALALTAGAAGLAAT